jgi:CO/xanthine dehydrogenase Mo-binding subunit
MSELDYVGKRILRKDGPDKVTGKAIYTVDIQPKGKLVGRILRSPHAHARILDIDTSLALAVPGVKAVITGKDTLGIKHGFVETPAIQRINIPWPWTRFDLLVKKWLLWQPRMCMPRIKH